jgi:mersacidin/lichenicidin family type 2 lantibiotic
MLKSEIIRAWKDVEFRKKPSGTDYAAIPVHPAGVAYMVDAELQRVSAHGSAANTGNYLTLGCCGLTASVITWGCCVSMDSICKEA